MSLTFLQFLKLKQKRNKLNKTKHIHFLYFISVVSRLLENQNTLYALSKTRKHLFEQLACKFVCNPPKTRFLHTRFTMLFVPQVILCNKHARINSTTNNTQSTFPTKHTEKDKGKVYVLCPLESKLINALAVWLFFFKLLNVDGLFSACNHFFMIWQWLLWFWSLTYVQFLLFAKFQWWLDVFVSVCVCLRNLTSF